MGRLLILIFPEVRNALLLTRDTVSAPVCIRGDARVRSDCLRVDLTQTEALVPEKRPPLSLSLSLLLLLLLRSLSLRTQRAAS